MKCLLPVFCRPLGYAVIVLGLFCPFLLFMTGSVTDENIVLVRESSKLLMMAGACMILFALKKDESEETEKIRVAAMRNALFITILYVFINMVYRVYKGDILNMNTSSFLIFLIMNVICLEFGINKARIDKFLKDSIFLIKLFPV